MPARYTYLTALIILYLTGGNVYAQTDTLKLTFKDAEKAFLDKNLDLLASKYNVDAAKALVQQARLWTTPF